MKPIQIFIGFILGIIFTVGMLNLSCYMAEKTVDCFFANKVQQDDEIANLRAFMDSRGE